MSSPLKSFTLSDKLSWSAPENDDVESSLEVDNPIVESIPETLSTGTPLAATEVKTIIETDNLDGLVCIHFNECNNDSSDDHKQFRGIIKEKETDKIICKTFGYTPEIVEDDSENTERFIMPMVNANATCFYSYEGSLLRMFCYKEKWYLSTHRKISAFRSRWGFGKSYGDLFAEYLKRFDNFKELENQDIIQAFGKNFQQNQVFVFLITSYKENRIVSNRLLESPNLYIVGRFENVNDESRFINNFDDLSFEGGFIPAPEKHDISNPNVNIHIDTKQGLVFIDDKGNSAKLINKEYAELVALRKNNPNIILRYIELQQEGDKTKLEKFMKLYEDFSHKFKEYNDILLDIIGNVFRKYRNRFVRKLESIAPPEQYYIIRELHESYLQNNQNIVTPQRVDSYIKSLKPDRLFNLYSQYLKRKQQNGHGNKIKDDFRTKVKDIIYAK